jgi:hypothetical protein
MMATDVLAALVELGKHLSSLHYCIVAPSPTCPALQCVALR